jgi:CRISPR-associated protein Cas6/Cse3/CasE subtype I-E
MHPDLDKNDRKFVWRNRHDKSDGTNDILQVRSIVEPVLARLPADFRVIDFAKSAATFQTGERFRFLLTASPDRTIDGRRRRLIRADNEKVEWVLNKFKGAAEILSVDIQSVDERRVCRQGRVDMTLLVTSFVGGLKVIDPDAFARLYLLGVGHSKVWGSGMLSVKR